MVSIAFSCDLDYELEITMPVLSQFHYCGLGLWWLVMSSERCMVSPFQMDDPKGIVHLSNLSIFL